MLRLHSAGMKTGPLAADRPAWRGGACSELGTGAEPQAVLKVHIERWVAAWKAAGAVWEILAEGVVWDDAGLVSPWRLRLVDSLGLLGTLGPAGSCPMLVADALPEASTLAAVLPVEGVRQTWSEE